MSHCSFLHNNGEIYVECLVTAKVYIIREGFIGIVEKVYNTLDDIKIAPKGDFGFDWLDKYNISLNGIVFNGEDEIEKFLRWFDKVML